MKEEVTSPHGFENWRLYLIYGVIITVFVFYAFRLFQLQILRGEDYVDRAEENRKTAVNIPTQRGIIFDRNGYVLARNVAAYNVTITPANLPEDPGAIQEVYRKVSLYTGVPVSKGTTDTATVRSFKPCETDIGITQIVYIGDTNAPYDPVRIKCNVDANIALVIRENAADMPGVGIEIEPVREYPTGWLTSEIIGFLGPIPANLETYYRDLGFVSGRDKVGYAGVEATLQDKLSGKNGLRMVEVDSAGKELRDLQAPIDPIPGNNIRLTIDTRLQSAAKEALIGDINWWNTNLGQIRSQNGVAIAMNPKTGEILALVSYPSFENNRMARIIPAYYYQQLNQDPNRPLFNHAISAEHPPGSVYKMATAIGILNEGLITVEKEVFDPGKITIMQKFTPNDPGTPKDFVCYDRNGHGNVSYLRGIALSCDVYFYKIGGGYQNEVPEGLGIWRMGEYARALGYGQKSGIELPGEAKGLVPDPNWKRLNLGENWATGDTYIATIGQGFVLATPLQVLESFATLANDGKKMKPTLVREVLDADGNIVEPFKPVQQWDITKDPVIAVYDKNNITTGEKKIVQPWVIQKAKEGMRMVVTEGTVQKVFAGKMDIPSAGKTGTAEYCDNVAQQKNLCQPGNWPTHAWYAGYAPYDNPEIVVVAFVYNGGEGSSVAGPIVLKILKAYFELKSIDTNKGGS
ncbi:MAG TPA: penicillin-binding protein 2 [Anaerolineaceae bacterium]